VTIPNNLLGCLCTFGEDQAVGYILTIYFCDKVKGTTYRSKYKQ